jgi:hypothetical protein
MACKIVRYLAVLESCHEPIYLLQSELVCTNSPNHGYIERLQLVRHKQRSKTFAAKRLQLSCYEPLNRLAFHFVFGCYF